MPHAPGDVLSLELSADPADLTALRRHLARRFPGRVGRARGLSVVWHDDEDAALAAGGLAVAAWQEQRGAGGWCAVSLAPSTARPLLIGAAVPPLGSAAAAAGLEIGELALPAPLLAVLRLDGRRRQCVPGEDGVSARLYDGIVGRAGEEPMPGRGAIVRLALSGPAAAVAALAQELAAALRLGVPILPLAGEARVLAGLATPPRPLGAPVLPGGLPTGEAFAHAASHLMGVMLHHAPHAGAGITGEPVHQMRVAMRRLRSIIGVFRDVVGCPEVEELAQALRPLGAVLGPARDWDVFLAGTGRDIARAFPDEAAVATLIAAAEARRTGAYADLAAWLNGPDLRLLGLRVAVLAQTRPWEAAVPEPAAEDLAQFGADLLARRLRRVLKQGEHLGKLPEAALHELRLKAKRLRYAAELFAPLHPGRTSRRFLRRLSALQEALGLLNDGVVAAGLMHELADAGGDGLAGGMVRGFVAARASGARARITRAWRRLRKAAPFWK